MKKMMFQSEPQKQEIFPNFFRNFGISFIITLFINPKKKKVFFFFYGGYKKKEELTGELLADRYLSGGQKKNERKIKSLKRKGNKAQHTTQLSLSFRD